MTLQRLRLHSLVLAYLEKLSFPQVQYFYRCLLVASAAICFASTFSVAQENAVKESEEAKPVQEQEVPSKKEKAEEVEKAKDEKVVEMPKPTLAIVNASIQSVASAPISNGKILIAGDTIIGIGGAELVVPEGIETIDAAGMVITPGWIDVSSRLWLSQAGATPVNNFNSGFNNFNRNFNNFNEFAGNVAATEEAVSDGSLKAVDGLDPFAEDWKDVVATGVTTVYVQPSSQNPMGGLGAAISVSPDSNGKLVIHNSASSLQMSLGKFASNRDRSARFEALKNGLQSIADYKKKWDDYEEASKKAEKEAATGPAPPAEARREGEGQNAERPATGGGQGFPERRGGFRREGFGGGREGQEGRGGFPGRTRPDGQVPTPGADTRTAGQNPTPPPAKPKKPDVEPLKQRLLGVLSGEIPIRLEIHNANDTHYALELKKLFPNTNWSLEDVDQLGSSVGLIRDSRLPLVIGSWLQFSRLDANVEKRKEGIEKLITDSDSLIAIASKSAASNGSQYLREHLAQAIACGLSRDKALAAVTSDAAKLIGCDKKVGVLAVGYRADIVGFNGDPLDTSVSVGMVLCGGKVVVRATRPIVDAASADPLANVLPTAVPKKFQIHSTQVLTSEGFKDATLTIDDGKIVTVEDGLKPNGEDEMIDVGSAILTPGLQSVYTTLGLDSVLRGVDSNSAHLSPGDLASLDLDSRKAVQNTGLHVVALATGSTNTLPGQLSLFAMSDDASPISAPVAAKIVLSAEARSADRFPSSLAGQVKFVRDALSLNVEPSRLFIPEKTTEYLTSQKQDVMKNLLEQSKVAFFWASNDAELEAALQIVEQFKLKAAVAGHRDIGKHAERLKALNVSVVAVPLLETDFPQYVEGLVDCHRQGVAVYFAGDHGDQIRLSAAKAVQAGVSKDWALQVITSGIQKLYGTQITSGMTMGNNADLIVWSGNPLDLTSQPLLQICNGVVSTEKDKP